MKVRCIDTKNNSFNLTYNKVYEVMGETENYYAVVNDDGCLMNFHKSRFEVVECEKPSGVKDDAGKLKPTLLLDDMPNAINEVLKVLKFGADKYSEGNWLLVEDGESRYRNAADRHRLSQGKLDSESGLSHLAHEAANILMLLELKLKKERSDEK